MKALGKFFKWVEIALELIMGILLAFMIITIFINVIDRYCFGFAIPWSEEMSRWAMVWMCFIGVVLAFIHDDHMGLDLITSKFHGRMKYLSDTIIFAIILFISYLLTDGAVELTIKNVRWISSATGASYSYLYAAGILQGVLLLLLSVYKLAISIGSLIMNKPLSPFAKHTGRQNKHC